MVQDSVRWQIRLGTEADGVGDPPSPRGFTMVCYVDRLVGHAQVSESDGVYHLVDLFVEPEWSERGVDQALVTAVEAEVIARGATALTLVTKRAAFLAELGYQMTEDLPVALRPLNKPGHQPMMKELAQPVHPHPAVSVLPLRDGPKGLEVFVQHRVGTMDFAADAVVFPGGRVDPRDYDNQLTIAAEVSSAWSHTALPPADVLVSAAIREVAEECGIELAARNLVPWDNWVTPPGGRRRFDVAFFLTFVRPEQHIAWQNTTTEALRSAWESVKSLLDDNEAGWIRLMAPTKALLTELGTFDKVADALAYRPNITPVLDDDPVRPRPSTI
ncbi:GNAT family N-acetyltransferase [Corynebacterium breve]|uniref:GNAT family N-acetyltransferase n=1 Tax=Corynebacterium breve TaxID=3049799 RepID=A0ABY8VGH8_9CORY|nr:GNAT family N-acetyltransferase [Corynebacterium breve]WIM68608.1 GNAT family N-acetyltransferase [Corynebacterium breve]